jgi:hypothetical protein
MSARVRNLTLGVGLGAAGALLVSMGVLGLVLALVALLVAAYLRRSFWVLGAGFVAAGTIWMLFMALRWTSCEASQACGDLDLAPFLLASSTLIGLGLLAGGAAWWQERRRSSPTP